MTWVAALCLLPMLSTYVHLLLVQHVTCPEHGEIIDRSAGVSLDTPVGSPVRPDASAQSGWRGTESDDPHSHSHCIFVLNRRQSASAPTHIRAYLAPPTEQPTGLARLAVRPVADIALFRLAPKQSPPA